MILFTHNEIARIAHETIRSYCDLMEMDPLPAWDEAPAWVQNSAIDGVRFHIENPDASASASHESWYEYKAKEGWVWGPKKDPAKREHPCMVPFNELPPIQQVKDHLFKSIVGAMAHDFS